MTEHHSPPSYTPRPESITDPPFYSVAIDYSQLVPAGTEKQHL